MNILIRFFSGLGIALQEVCQCVSQICRGGEVHSEPLNSSGLNRAISICSDRQQAYAHEASKAGDLAQVVNENGRGSIINNFKNVSANLNASYNVIPHNHPSLGELNARSAGLLKESSI